MRRIQLRPKARRDLAEAKRWYAEQQTGLDEQLRSHLRILLSRIAEFPRLFACTSIPEIRRASSIGPFPYSVYYRERGEVIEILAILHNARHPREWRQRVR